MPNTAPHPHNEQEKRPASVGNPIVEAIVNGLFKFTAPHQLMIRLNQLREKFLISKDQDHMKPDTLKLWIKGFALTEEEKARGYLGNYALIYAKQSTEGKHYTLVADKLLIDLKHHPRKKRPKLKHPDWGHPILRAVLKKKLYPTIEAIQAEFARLHEEFPEVSIPNVDKLHIIVYQKGKSVPGQHLEGDHPVSPGVQYDKGNPVQKITLRIRPNEDGQFHMSYTLNKKKPKYTPQQPGTAAGGAAGPAKQTTKGYFTALVSLKKKKGITPKAGTAQQPEKPEEKKSE